MNFTGRQFYAVKFNLKAEVTETVRADSPEEAVIMAKKNIREDYGNVGISKISIEGEFGYKKEIK